MLDRPLLTLTTASTMMVLILSFALMFAVKRSHDRFDTVVAVLGAMNGLEASVRSVIGSDRNATPPRLAAGIDDIAARLEAVEAQESRLLDGAYPVAGDAANSPAPRREYLLDALTREARAELWLAQGVAALLATGMVLMAWLMSQHVHRPLVVLNGLLSTMARRRYERAESASDSPLLGPLFESYNDLVERVRTSEEAQARREAELRQELREATRALLQQQVSLAREQRLAATGEFAAQLAHDLRNPLAGILAAVENLLRDSIGDDHRGRLSMVRDEVRRIARQLDGLVDASRQSPEPSRPLSVCELAESLLSLASYQLPPGVELGCKVPHDLVLNVPESGLRQALLNLLLNAASALGDGPGHIEIVSDSTQERISLSVIDSGPGFSQEVLDAGVRAFNTSRAGGTGLGLAAARRFIRDLGGELELSNREGGGARVTLEFPARLRDG